MRTARVAALAAVVVGTVISASLAPAGAASASSARPAVRSLVVSPHGSDSAPGTASRPLRTIQVAVDRLRSGGRVELRGGVYHQRVRLVGIHGVTLSPYRGEHVTLSGSGLTPPRGLTALVEIADSSAVTVSGLELTGYWTSRLGVVPAGIYVHGHDRGVSIDGNHVHDLGNTNGTLGSFDINAHGIAVYGDDPQGPVSGLSISGNEVDHLRLGASETVVVNGNVDGWAITGQPDLRRRQHRHRRHRLRADAHRCLPLHDGQPGPQRGHRRQPGEPDPLARQPGVLAGRLGCGRLVQLRRRHLRRRRHAHPDQRQPCAGQRHRHRGGGREPARQRRPRGRAGATG